MIIGLVGYAQSGKDTVANILVEQHGFERRAFADKIRDFVYELNPTIKLGYDTTTNVQLMVDQFGWDKAKQEPKIRELLQGIGVAARNNIHDKVWINAALTNMQPNKRYVITDVRFSNEIYALKDLGAEIWRIERPGVGPVNNHVSEKELEGFSTDRSLLNVGTLDELTELVKLRLDSYLANQNN